MDRQWKYKIQLNAVLRTLTTDYDISGDHMPIPKQIKHEICTELNEARPLRKFIPIIKAASSIKQLYHVMDIIADEADLCRVWCGD